MTRSDDRGIATVGHSSHHPEAFLALLHSAGIEQLVDVRRYPGSRRVSWTNSQALSQLLAAESIGYLHLEALGGRRRPVAESPNARWRNPQFRGYADHLSSAAFKQGLLQLEATARRKRTAVMCAEALWWRCHRRLLADVLLVRGWDVSHIGSRGEVSQHALTDFARVDGTRVTYPATSTDE